MSPGFYEPAMWFTLGMTMSLIPMTYGIVQDERTRRKRPRPPVAAEELRAVSNELERLSRVVTSLAQRQPEQSPAPERASA